MDTRTITANQHFTANFERLVTNGSGQPRYVTYLTGWRLGFGALSEDNQPRDLNGLSIAKWRALFHFYTANQLPHAGDRVYNLRYTRTGLLIGERYSIVQVQRHPVNNICTLLLSESTTL